MTIDEFKNTLNMLISKEPETIQLAQSIIEVEFPQYQPFDYYLRDQFGRFVIAQYYYDSDYALLSYANYLREKICPYIIYSPFKHCFV